MIKVLCEQAADLKRPPLTFDDVLDELAILTPTFCRQVRGSLPVDR